MKLYQVKIYNEKTKEFVGFLATPKKKDTFSLSIAAKMAKDFEENNLNRVAHIVSFLILRYENASENKN